MRDWLKILYLLNQAASVIGLFLAMLVFYFAGFFNAFIWLGKLVLKIWELM